MTKFEIGKKYATPSIGNSDILYTYEVIARTACTVTLKDKYGEIVKCRISKKISGYLNAEAVQPKGSYSMAPILDANEAA